MLVFGFVRFGSVLCVACTLLPLTLASAMSSPVSIRARERVRSIATPSPILSRPLPN